MGVDFAGDWDKAMGALDRLANKSRTELGKKIGRGIMMVERKVLDHMDDQDLGWDELNKKYAARKEKAQPRPLSPDTLRATNKMYENITTRQIDDFTGAVGVRRGVRTKDGEDVTDVAIIHEQPDNDGKIIPARKLWEPTFEEVKKELPPEIADCVRGLIK